MATNSQSSVVRQLRVLLEHYLLKEEDCSKKVSGIHLMKICSYCMKWRSLYPYLDMKHSDVVNVEHDGYDEDDKIRRFLERWQLQKGHDSTYKKLIHALLENGCKEEAEGVCALLSTPLLLQSPPPSPILPLSPSSKPTNSVSQAANPIPMLAGSNLAATPKTAEQGTFHYMNGVDKNNNYGSD